MKQVLFAILFATGLSFAKPSAAQSTTDDQNKLQFKLGAFYNSGLNYYGRTDSLRSSGFFPLAELWFGKSFYVNAAPVFINNSTQHFEYTGTVATAGYQARSNDEKVFFHIFFTKPFYEQGSQLVQSALKEQLSTILSWQTPIITFNAGADLKHSDKLDYGLSGGLDHVIRHDFPDGFNLVADPSIYAYFGTQQFTRTYYEQKNFLFFPGVEQSVTTQVNKLNVLSYEASAPIILSHDKLQLIVIPAFVIPQNLVVVENRPDLSERGKNMFYITAGVKYSF